MTQTAKIDDLIVVCNSASVEEAIARIAALTPEERDMLLKESKERPDWRFEDNLLIACSILRMGR